MSLKYKSMKEITERDYLNFIAKNDKVVIGGVEIKLQKNWNIKTFGPPKDYVLEQTTVWSFPNRGNWATHKRELVSLYT